MSQEEPTDAKPPLKDPKADQKAAQKPYVKPGNWVIKVVLALAAIVGVYVAFRTSSAFFPRWWAQRVAGQVNGSFTHGTLWGLFYGFVFTFIPLLLIFQIRRRFFSWPWRIVVVIVALALAAPNWLTLSVVAGTSKAAHAGERIFDVGAPNFRAATLIGVVAGALCAMALTGTSMMMKRRKNQVKALKGQLAERDKPAAGDEKH